MLYYCIFVQTCFNIENLRIMIDPRQDVLENTTTVIWHGHKALCTCNHCEKEQWGKLQLPGNVPLTELGNENVPSIEVEVGSSVHCNFICNFCSTKTEQQGDVYTEEETGTILIQWTPIIPQKEHWILLRLKNLFNFRRPAMQL